jgi:hypothetical protein
MEWKDYENITRHIYESLGYKSGVEIICHGNECRVLGKSGVWHQIDVLTSHSDGIHIYKTAIECKFWEKNINKDIVMKVAEIIEDAGINKGVIVSKNGFTTDGIEYARYKHIGLVELREMTDEDWEGRLKAITVEINILMPQYTGLNFIVSEMRTLSFPTEKANLGLFKLKRPGGVEEDLTAIVQDFNLEVAKQKEGEPFEKIYEVEQGTMVKYIPNGETFSITGLKISAFLRIGKTGFSIEGVDYVWLIMKSFFEGNTYTIGKDGEINQIVDGNV